MLSVALDGTRIGLAWVRPRHVVDSYGTFKPAAHRCILMPGDWDLNTYPFERNLIAYAALRHWRDGLSWEEVGAYDLQLDRIRKHGSRGADRQRTLADVIARYDRLDELYEKIKSDRELFVHDGYDGVYIHIARDDRPVFGQRGVHRFVISYLLDLPRIPVELGAIHPSASSAGLLTVPHS